LHGERVESAAGSALIEGAIVATTIALLLAALVRVPSERIRIRHAGAALHVMVVTPWSDIVRLGSDLLGASTGTTWTRVANPGPSESGVVAWESGPARVEIERTSTVVRAKWHEPSFRSGDLVEERSFIRIAY
jgi:hypothetical protein